MGLDWSFGVVGNIIHEHTLEDGRVVSGTKEFSGGTKVYIDWKNWHNYPRTQICVIGLGRYKKYEIVSLDPKLIENVRFQLIRKKSVLTIMDNVASLDGWVWDGRTAKDKKEAKRFAENWEEVVEESIENGKIDN